MGLFWIYRVIWGSGFLKSMGPLNKGYLGAIQGNIGLKVSQNYGSLLAIGYITTYNVQGYQNGTLILGTTRMASGAW